MSHRVTLLLGGNKGDMSSALRRAVELLKQRVGEVVATSRIYRSQAWGFHATEQFLNQAVVLRTNLEPEPLLDATQAIECELGRDRRAEAEQKAACGERYCSRTMDIDIMFYDNEVISTPRLQVPHPLMQERAFALEPLCELMEEFRHPTLGLTLRELNENLKQR